jgi:hypothetical protein
MRPPNRPIMQGDGAGGSAQRACERSNDRPRGAQPPAPKHISPAPKHISPAPKHMPVALGLLHLCNGGSERQCESPNRRRAVQNRPQAEPSTSPNCSVSCADPWRALLKATTNRCLRTASGDLPRDTDRRNAWPTGAHCDASAAAAHCTPKRLRRWSARTKVMGCGEKHRAVVAHPSGWSRSVAASAIPPNPVCS